MKGGKKNSKRQRLQSFGNVHAVFVGMCKWGGKAHISQGEDVFVMEVTFEGNMSGHQGGG